MKKLSSILCIGLIFILFSSCERPDLTDDVEMVYDTVNGINMWSSRSDHMDWESAVDYCNNLSESGYSDWRLPTISELRTLIQNCSGTELGGSCGVTNNCLSLRCWNDSCTNSCSPDDSGYYSKLGDTRSLWSSSSTDHAWRMDFDNAGVRQSNKADDFNSVRCVR